MSNKSWHLSRRMCLRGAGAALALPLLDGMLHGAAAKHELPARMACIFFPFGVAMPAANSDDRQWGWFPTGQGASYQLTRPLQPLAAYKKQFSVFTGLSHPKVRKLGGHDSGDTFLTGSGLETTRFTNSVSIDQYAAQHLGAATRFPSLTMSSDGGVGEPTRSTTLSFLPNGRPVPALASPQMIFERFFSKAGEKQARRDRLRLQNSASMLDLLGEHSRSLKADLGRRDQQKLDDYLASVRAMERRVAQSQKWLDIPRPEIDPSAVAVTANQKAPLEYLRAMYDLMFLAFQTDTTRLATYMIGQVAGATTIANAFPASIGLTGNWHGLAHGAGKKGGHEKLGRFDQFLAQQLAYFIGRLAETEEAGGVMLDRTMVLYGSSNSKTHRNHNYPLLLAGGGGLGLKHGKYLHFTEKTPLANLFVTMLNCLKTPTPAFADSTGEMREILA